VDVGALRHSSNGGRVNTDLNEKESKEIKFGTGTPPMQNEKVNSRIETLSIFENSKQKNCVQEFDFFRF
jgi:hypothetical protein